MRARRRIGVIVVVVGACASATASCGGKLLDDADATSSDAASEPEAYAGEWCNFSDWQYLFDSGGPTDSALGGADFCGVNPYVDAWTHCQFQIGGYVPWACCWDSETDCCPNFGTKHEYYTTCCASKTDCSDCCDGIHPGSWFRDY